MTLNPRSAALAAALFAGLSFSACQAQTPAPAAPTPASAVVQAGVSRLQLTAPDGRAVQVRVWQAADERAVIVFGHGLGGWPEAYDRLIARWVAAGFTVMAPLHVDSRQHPDRAAYQPQAGYMARLQDVRLTIDAAAAAHPGKPIVAAGHSYGTLFALTQAGAATPVGSSVHPAVVSVIGLSSPGAINGLVTAETYARVARPVMIVTGDQDLVPGYVADWRDHRLAFDGSPEGGKYLLTFQGGDHSLVRTADETDFEVLARATIDFVEATALNDAQASDRLSGLNAPGLIVERR